MKLKTILLASTLIFLATFAVFAKPPGEERPTPDCADSGSPAQLKITGFKLYYIDPEVNYMGSCKHLFAFKGNNKYELDYLGYFLRRDVVQSDASPYVNLAYKNINCIGQNETKLAVPITVYNGREFINGKDYEVYNFGKFNLDQGGTVAMKIRTSVHKTMIHGKPTNVYVVWEKTISTDFIYNSMNNYCCIMPYSWQGNIKYEQAPLQIIKPNICTGRCKNKFPPVYTNGGYMTGLKSQAYVSTFCGC